MKDGCIRLSRWTSWRILSALVLLCTPLPALADKCGPGHLRFVGTFADSSGTVWLSRTTQGSFRLEAAQGSQTVDTWVLPQPGLHVSTSPNVSSGNGGTHKLFDTTDGDCLLDTQNQKGGFTIPPNVTLPGIINHPRPVPPIGHWFPD